MNAFYEHHTDSIRFSYRCFDRILLNGLIQPFQQPERVVGFFGSYRQVYPVSRDVLRAAAEQFQAWVKAQAENWNAPIVEAPKGRRDEFVEPYFRGAQPDQVVVVVKAREPARIMTAIGDKKVNRWHLQIAERWVVQYNFYVNDARWGRMFVRMCPYLPFSARVCLNQHHWLANRMRDEAIDFQQCSNAFLRCGRPERLQELADSLTAADLSSCGSKWLARFTPFFSDTERRQAGCQHRLFFSQVEFCDNLIFRRRAALDKLGERLLDANRTIGQPNKITVIFGRKVTKQHRGKLQTEIEDMDLPNPVIRSHYAMASSNNTCVTTDHEGEVLDMLVQRRRDSRAALRLMRKLLKKQGFAPKLLVTDKLRSYACAFRHLRLTCPHEQGLRKNNRAENWHQPVRASVPHLVVGTARSLRRSGRPDAV